MTETEEEYCTDQCDSCRNVIVRTYHGVRACGRDDRSAFSSAVKVLCLRHPERTQEENIELASVWIAQALEAGLSSPGH
jgi:predicted DNA-binding ribbon-helix-helix protein